MFYLDLPTSQGPKCIVFWEVDDTQWCA